MLRALLLCCTIHAFADSTFLCSLQVAELEEFLFAKGPTSEAQHAEDGAERPIAELVLQASACTHSQGLEALTDSLTPSTEHMEARKSIGLPNSQNLFILQDRA